MLVPLTRQKFEQLIPRIATGTQYRYYWGKFSDCLNRLLISVVAVVVFWLLGLVLGESFGTILFSLGLVAGLYWLWGPILWASLRNGKYRRYKYSGFFRGHVLDVRLRCIELGTAASVFVDDEDFAFVRDDPEFIRVTQSSTR